jgi:AraC-like DNA-binding protein
VNKLRALVEKHYTTVHAPGEYAEMLCVSQNHLNSTVRKMLDKTIGDLVHERIILEAQRLLFNTELSVKEIAFGLNYDDPSYFTRFFRKHTGLSPQEFRESARKKHQ